MTVRRIVLYALLAATTAAGAAPAHAAAFTLTSTAFAPGGIIPKVHECTSGGQTDPGRRNESPPLTWSGGPAGTQSYALVMRDLDNANLIHWVIHDIPAGATSLPQNVDHAYRPTVPAGARQIYYRGSASLYGYQGPCSPWSINTYQFTVHALNRATLSELSSSSSTTTAARVISGASLGTATLSGES
ncbi:YbhB/YbcL family Raf kinase inhibitor-like protein [Nonomuraea spiralis]|uniref:YbhB/YbcL family Raf kinase inhibitor-like protein n=1 Tax=Nonomuraea TaxID=83681 RepID=UPI000F7BA3E2|nr:YbhB/YbcL family Raf kinase inhibitor-like protein [Nonomuraea sp. WAC 01424]RSN14389.1 YbhB/YbcL family Raf kinase inhibitor-like protein [Nonomuraea sp. WAC 01424]